MTSDRDTGAGTGQEAPATPPVGIKAGDGQYFFGLTNLNDIQAGPRYSTAHGALVTGERIMVGLMRMPRGTGARAHSHPNEQWIYVLEGTLTAEVGGVKSEAGPGSLVYIPANVVHAAGASSEQDVVFLTAKDTTHGIWGNAVEHQTAV